MANSIIIVKIWKKWESNLSTLHIFNLKKIQKRFILRLKTWNVLWKFWKDLVVFLWTFTHINKIEIHFYKSLNLWKSYSHKQPWIYYICRILVSSRDSSASIKYLDKLFEFFIPTISHFLTNLLLNRLSHHRHETWCSCHAFRETMCSFKAISQTGLSWTLLTGKAAAIWTEISQLKTDIRLMMIQAAWTFHGLIGSLITLVTIQSTIQFTLWRIFDRNRTLAICTFVYSSDAIPCSSWSYAVASPHNDET